MYEPFLPRFDRTEFGAGTWAVVLDSRRVLEEPTYMKDELTLLAQDTEKLETMRETIIAFMPRIQYPRISQQLSRYQPDALKVLGRLMSDRGLAQVVKDEY